MCVGEHRDGIRKFFQYRTSQPRSSLHMRQNDLISTALSPSRTMGRYSAKAQKAHPSRLSASPSKEAKALSSDKANGGRTPPWLPNGLHLQKRRPTHPELSNYSLTHVYPQLHRAFAREVTVKSWLSWARVYRPCCP